MAIGVGSGRGVLRVISPDNLNQAEASRDRLRAEAETRFSDKSLWQTNLAGFIDGEFSRFQRHRDSASGWSDRLVEALRVFKGEYDPTKLAAIKKFGGSTIYSRLVAGKCRSASAMLQDVYLSTDRPWGLDPTPDPALPENITAAVLQVAATEAKSAEMMGAPPDAGAVRDRVSGLIRAAFEATIKKARQEAKRAQSKLDDILTEGGFYEALSQFSVDLPLFPYACIKGPIVRMLPQVTYVQGRAQVVDKPKMLWNRVSPFDLWWTPGVADIADAAVIERSRLTRPDLNQLLGLPGYNEEAIREILTEYGRKGYVETNASTADTPRAQMESRENPTMNESGLIDMLEYHGYVQGALLLDYGLSETEIPDKERDYFVDVFKVGRYIIKAALSPSLRKRPPYYITSFEKVPGTIVGNALPDILADIADAANGALRSLVNNMSIASGPQVDINDDRIAENEDSDELYPWKRWHTTSDPMGNNQQPAIRFFQPETRAQELMGVYEKFTVMADEVSAIPRYMTGSQQTGGGAGRTASGLAMLMGNSAKILQMVAANIDADVMEPVIGELYDMVMLTDTTNMLRGDESIVVLGVNVAMQRETERQRQLEFLQITANPVDSQITGIRGRANVLRAVADGIGLKGEEIVPPDDQLAAQEAAQGAGMGPPGAPPGGAPGGPGAPPGPPGPPGAPPGPGGPPPGPGGPPGPQAPAPGPPAQGQTNVVGPARGPGGAG